MITPIPNQPLNFSPSRLQGCVCNDPEECTLVDKSDTFSVQFLYQPCLITPPAPSPPQILPDPNFQSTTDWQANFWSIDPGNACTALSSGISPITEQTFTPTVGNSYFVRVTPNYIHTLFPGHGIEVRLGGLSQVIPAGSTSEPWSITFTATTTEMLSLRQSFDGVTACIASVEVYGADVDLTVQLRDNGGLVSEFDYNTTNFVIGQKAITIAFTLADFPDPINNGCYTLRVIDNCDNTSFDSGCVKIGTFDECTILFTACNANDAIGFYDGFTPSVRLYAKIVRPTFDYEIGEERGSDGRINRYFGDRKRKMELRIGRMGESGHNFVSTWPLYDHIYAEREEYVVGGETYQPAYGDVYDSVGEVLLGITPKQELARKVRCDEELAGCRPPPNYLVQGTGPNENFITAVNGDLILIR